MIEKLIKTCRLTLVTPTHWAVYDKVLFQWSLHTCLTIFIYRRPYSQWCCSSFNAQTSPDLHKEYSYFICNITETKYIYPYQIPKKCSTVKLNDFYQWPWPVAVNNKTYMYIHRNIPIFTFSYTYKNTNMYDESLKSHRGMM